jgi:hypothetical protein
VVDPLSTTRLPPRTLLVACVLAVAAAALFFGPFLLGGSLHGYDWGSHHYNYFDWVRISLTQYHTLPLFMNDAWITKNFLANAEAPTLGPLVGLLWILPTGAYIKLLVVVFTAAGLVGTFFLLRDLGVVGPVAAFAAVVFAFNGFFVSHTCVGHHWVLGAQLLPGLLCLFRRAALGSAAALVAAAALNAFTIGGGQHQPFIWQNLLLSMFALLWAIQLRALFPIWRWGLVLLATAGLAAVQLLPLVAEFADYDPAQRTAGLPLGLLWSSAAGGGQHPELVRPGVDGAHGGGWWEYAFFVGPLALALFVVGLAAARRCWPLIVIGSFFFVLAIDWPVTLAWLDVWPRILDLPVWRSQRSPSRFLFLALFGLVVAGSVGLQRLWQLAQRRSSRPLLGQPMLAQLLPGMAAVLTLLVAGQLFIESLPWQRAALGEPLASRDHRPRPLRLGSPGTATVELHEFAPNRLVYRARARRETRIVFPFRLGEGTDEWRVDGLPALTERGKLALDVPPGEREIAMIYRPQLFHLGLVITAASAIALVAIPFLCSRRRRAAAAPNS